MSTLTYNLRQHPIGWALAINALALVVYACSPLAGEYPVVVLGIQAFILVQLFLPSCRPVWSAPLCPANIAQFFFWVQLVGVALLVGFYGFSQGTLPDLPSSWAIDTAICLRVLGYVSFCIAFHYFSKSQREATSTDEPDKRELRLHDSRSTAFLLLPYLAIGLVGFFLAYGSLSGYIEYVSSPVLQKERELQPATLATAAGTFLRPFLGFALVMAWSLWINPQRSGPARVGATAALVVLLLVVNFSYNRGSMLAPLIGVAAAYSLHVRRISVPTIVAAGVVALFASLAFGWYRSTEMQVADVSTSDVEETWSEERMVEFVQVYASGPQMTAYLIEELGSANTFYYGRTLVPSLVHTIPVLGKPFRDDSGMAVLNRLIYDDPSVVDQMISYDAELYINFHFPGVVLGYALLGWLLSCFQNWFMKAANPIESYAWLVLALWTIFPGSLPIVSQMYVYFFWPVYIYLLVKVLWSIRDRARLARQRDLQLEVIPQ
jgi:hypothetical protein